MRLVITHLYPDLMSTYGDRGNILALVRRCQWRGIDVEVNQATVGDRLDARATDLFFFGGGQDREQSVVSPDLLGEKGEALAEAIEDGAVVLAVCGGYQLLGKEYLGHTGEQLPGLGVLDVRTVAGRRRCIGNVVVESTIGGEPRTLVGFENHSGQTYLGPGCQPLGRVLQGCGNNGQDRTEGAVYRNVYGSYLHGSLLPKNPWLADHLLRRALGRRYGPDVELQPLDDTLENLAHRTVVERARVLGRTRSGAW